MLFRRISQHVKEQNWTAIVIDFLIVVFGVVVGLQVTNWNEERLDHKKGLNYLQRIHTDLQKDLNDINARIEFWNQVYAHGKKALNYIEINNEIKSSQWELLLAFYQASQIGFFNSIDTTYQELRSAGELDLIEDLSLRNDLSDYYVIIKRRMQSLGGYEPRYREEIRGLVPTEVQNYIWGNCHQNLPNGQQQLIECESPIDEIVAETIVEKIVSEEQMIRHLRFWITNQKITIMVANVDKQTAEDLANKVKQFIQRH
jgi:hypothetical protein